MRRLGLLQAVVLVIIACQPVLAEQLFPDAPLQSALPVQSVILTVKQQELFENSAFGTASLARLEALSRSLQAENRQIEAALEAEERSLTDTRATLPAPEFRALAATFDQKVEGIRAAQEAKARDVTRQRDIDRQSFFEAAGPVLASLVRQKGAVVLLDQSAVVLSLDAIDITDEAIAVIDSRLSPPESPPFKPLVPVPTP